MPNIYCSWTSKKTKNKKDHNLHGYMSGFDSSKLLKTLLNWYNSFLYKANSFIIARWYSAIMI